MSFYYDTNVFFSIYLYRYLKPTSAIVQDLREEGLGRRSA